MKMGFWFFLTASLLVSACASQAPSQPATDVSNKDSAAGKLVVCSDKTTASVACSNTVTAVFDSKGRLWVAWVNQDHVYVQRSGDKGNSFSEPVVVNKIAEPIIAHDEYRPKIQLDQQGNIFLTWTRSLDKRHTGHIRFSRSLDGGKSFSEPVTVNDNQDVISHRFDSLLVGENGEIFIAWLDARDKEKAKTGSAEFLGTSLYYAWSDDGGKSFHANQLVAPHTCECCRLGTALDLDNLPVVIWRHVFPGGIRDHALIKFENWQTPGELRQLSHENWKIDACPHHGPALAIADDGAYHAVWFSGAESRQGLYYGYSTDQGLTFAGSMHFGGQGAMHPHLATLGQQVAITWLEFDGTNTVVRLLRSSDAGKSWSEPRQVATAAGPADYPYLVADRAAIYLSWRNGQGYQIRALESF
ncbi:exo-alpha-sialidase [Methylomonas sp. LL1]|uniref:sialidase family protein n=1 Tax=Methylomonas sp. LL1 TaxID=2785785 RepID=UPI0018C36AB7|nr:sialidase family protein [Methylomonas sp. LL1]QPK64226.1 exo-alpha-sialidase [Methylomonas sp. LL1]